MMSGKNILEVKSLTVRYGNFVALNDVSFEVKKGEFFSLLGPSGSGKSTLLMSMAGFVRPERGEIHIGGKVVTNRSKNIFIPPKARKIGMLFQDFSIYPSLTVNESLTLPLQARRKDLSKEEINKKVESITNSMGIIHLLHRKPHEMSGGELRRAGLAKALITDPELIFLDEPLSALDARVRDKLSIEIRGWQQKKKWSVVSVTHDQYEALSMADRIMILNKGNVMQISTPDKIYDRPANLFVAQFIGTPRMNIINNCVIKKGSQGKLLCVHGDIKIPLPEEAKLKKFIGQTVTVGVRPPHVKLAYSRGSGDFEAKVIITEFVGSRNYIYLGVGDVTLCSEDERAPKSGERTKVVLDLDKIYVFDKEGKTIFPYEERSRI